MSKHVEFVVLEKVSSRTKVNIISENKTKNIIKTNKEKLTKIELIW